NTRTKWGRRRPYIFGGGLFVIAAFALLFIPLNGLSNNAAKIAIYTVGYMFYNTLSTVIAVSYSSMSTEIATSSKETTQVNTLRLLFSMCSGGIATVGGAALLEQYLSGAFNATTLYLIIVLGFGILYTVPLVLTGLYTHERVELPKEKSTFSFKTFIKPFKVKAFVFLLLGYLSAYVCMDLLSTNIVYFSNYALTANVGGSVILAVIMVCTGVTLPLYYYLMAKGWAKPVLFRLGIPVYIVGIVLLTMIETSSAILVLGFCVIIGLGMGGSQLMPWIIFPDVVDVAELKYKDRPTGSFSGVMTFTKKCSSAIAIFLSGIILKAVGFVEPVADEITGKIDYADFVQPTSAVWGIRIMILAVVAVFMISAFIAMSKLKLSQKRAERVRELIEKNRKNEPFTAEDQADYDKIAKDLF
ncbi:MAG: MFS transporter, partial [Bacillota bacterium]